MNWNEVHEVTVHCYALDEAAARDQDPAGPRGPLHGVPILIKDNIDVRGLPATAGSPALRGAGDRGDAFLVARLREAGAVILGKANLSERVDPTSAPTARPAAGARWVARAANPHALDRNLSGSSSGSGMAVAAGLAPMAVGTETDGSIVCPASACGVVGLKPTLGLVSRHGIVPVSSAQDTAGPMTSDRYRGRGAARRAGRAGSRGTVTTAAGGSGLPDYTSAFLDAGALAGARLGVWRDIPRPARGGRHDHGRPRPGPGRAARPRRHRRRPRRDSSARPESRGAPNGRRCCTNSSARHQRVPARTCPAPRRGRSRGPHRLQYP